MGIDWEEILDAEGADIAGVYEDSLPEEDCGTAENYDDNTSEECEDGRPADNDVLGQLENMTHDELVDAYIYCKMDLDAVEGRLGDTEFFLEHAKQDLQTLMDILKEHGIQIPKDVEERVNDLTIWG